MICPVVTYAPTAATKPNIAAQPLKRSASGVMIKNKKYVNSVTAIMKLCKVIFSFFARFRDLVGIIPYFYSIVTKMSQKFLSL